MRAASAVVLGVLATATAALAAVAWFDTNRLLGPGPSGHERSRKLGQLRRGAVACAVAAFTLALAAAAVVLG